MAVGKGSLLRAANATAGRKKMADVEVHQKMDSRETEEKMISEKKNSGRRRSVTVQEQTSGTAWVNKVPSEQLREIPSDWRGPKYVKPNVSALAESISRWGIIEPLPVVQTEKDTYQLVGGSRRMDVVKMLGILEVPVVVLPGSSMEDAKHYYEELKPYSDAAQDTIHNAKFRTAALFGAQRIPEYLL